MNALKIPGRGAALRVVQITGVPNPASGACLAALRSDGAVFCRGVTALDQWSRLSPVPGVEEGAGRRPPAEHLRAALLRACLDALACA